MRDEAFFVCGIRDWLQTFAEYEIQIEQTIFGMQDRTKKQLGVQEMTWFFAGYGIRTSPSGAPLLLPRLQINSVKQIVDLPLY